MYNIGDSIRLKDVNCCLSSTGAHMYLDPPIDIEGVVTVTSNFVNKRVCIEFLHNFQKHTVWKYEFDLPAK